MLRQLSITNIAIVDALSVDFRSGLTVITGETGAGKSILMDALMLAFGAKMSPKEILRHGAERGSVELLCDIAGLAHEKTIRLALQDAGVDLDAGESEILISRELTATGSRMRINGSPVAREVLTKIRPLLLDVHGQHELTQLFDTDYQKAYLDSLGGETVATLKASVGKAYGAWSEKRRQLESIRTNRQAFEQQRDFLSFQLQELTDAQLNEPAEDTALQQELQVLSHAEKLIQNSGKAIALLSDGGERPSVLDQVDKLRGVVDVMADCDPSLKPLLGEVDGAYAQLQEASSILARYADRIEYNPERIKEIVDRLDVLEKIKRKYGPQLTDAIAKREAVEQELATLSLDEEGLEKLAQECATLEAAARSQAVELTTLRKAVAQRLNEQLVEELKTLALPAVRFEVNFSEKALSEDGVDEIEFLFSANPGEPVKPMAKTASGGELSRVLLALKVISAQEEKTGTLVFDEIDTGISGTTARAVSEKLVRLSTQSNDAQVLVITHQLTVAVMADAHLYVEKTQGGNAVTVGVSAVDGDEAKRGVVLSRMASGMTSDDETIARFVQKLCDEAAVFKNSLQPACKKSSGSRV